LIQVLKRSVKLLQYRDVLRLLSFAVPVDKVVFVLAA